MDLMILELFPVAHPSWNAQIISDCSTVQLAPVGRARLAGSGSEEPRWPRGPHPPDPPNPSPDPPSPTPGYLRRCRGRSPSLAAGWRRLCSCPRRSPGWPCRRDPPRARGCWPRGSLRAALGWSLPGKRVRQNSVEHCSYSRLVCRE